MKITISTEKVLRTLQRNYDAHRIEYLNQLDGWQQKMQEYTASLNEWSIRGGNAEKRPSQPAKPQQFDKEYVRYITILQHHELPDIVLGDHEFEEMVLDNFSWRNTFASNSMMYSNGGFSDGEV